MKVTNWKTVYQVAFMPNFFPVNAYLVEEEDGLTLIDAALPYSAKAILAEADRMGRPILRIVLTHAHMDHVGALDTLKRALPDAKVYISARDARLLAGDRTLEPNEPQTPIRGGVPKGLQTRPDVLLQDGDRIGSLLAISAPGHTPGSMAFLDMRNGALIAGDALQTHAGIAVSGQVRPWFPFPALATWNKQEALHSAIKLLRHRPKLLAVGHGPMLEGPVSSMDRAIALAARKLGAAPLEGSH